ncbi:DUF3089 domain-containing protein [Glacieibacterium frigidum]|uniref:DUF3089 domain-containing protein n=1 Tax=Glacieibacterium frigidum TaxID=2593303 RepID=A0A552U8C6_9SPHN|nr:DUF3089 domain-containing protein [Glacieibacterium frigidum]TRW14439.1 DUF3089 domain-containing protein [Glacieibacterium frigidum]
MIGHLLLLAAASVPVAFAEQTPPPAPDYALAAFWAAGPAGPGASAAVPEGATPAARRPPADVFFIHPTTFRTTTQWNQDAGDAATNAWTDASSIARQASAFNACCRVFAPRYRQASFLSKDDGRDRALDLAYGDIERAFDVFLRANRGRPFILAGHSQGGLMVARLVERRIDGTPLAKRLIATYAVGMNVAEGEFGRTIKKVPICDRPAQTGCMVQWNAVLPSTDLAAAAKRSEQAYLDRFHAEAGKTTLCVNPLTFDRAQPSADAERSRGAVPGDPGAGPIRPLVPHAVAARCEQGFLVATPNPALELKALPGGSLHYHDFGLFYADVRANAVLRTQAWLKARR